jgi:tRNA 2-selenouridine synthase
MIRKVSAVEFVSLTKKHPVLDVRSPSEYNHAHIPGAFNFPLFSDDERKVVGTLYKQAGRKNAIKQGLAYFGPKMTGMVEEAERIVALYSPANAAAKKENNCVLVHCWRGGMRSAGVAWLLDLYGFKVYTLERGYQAFRGWVLVQFEQPYTLNVLGGFTGSGKTEVLQKLKHAGQPVIDLEGIANHKGSAFGGIGSGAQPTQEMFENILAMHLDEVSDECNSEAIWVEDESRRIGQINIPDGLWKSMNAAPLYFLDVPFEERLSYITGIYGQLDQGELVNATLRIKKRLGGMNAQQATAYLQEDNYSEGFRILLSYYDKQYNKSLSERNSIIYKIAAQQTDAAVNSRLLTSEKSQEIWKHQQGR